MRLSFYALLLLPLSAALSSLECVHKCLTDPILSMLPSEDEIRGIAQRGMAGDFTMRSELQNPSKLQNMTGHEFGCSILNGVVTCLGECGTLESSNQQEYFQRTLGAVHGAVCSMPETLVKHVFARSSKDLFRCYDDQRPEELAASVIGAWMVSGGVDGADANTNLCYLGSSIARALVDNHCSSDVKWIVVSAVEFFYRLSALKLGISNVPTTEQPGLDGVCHDFGNFVDKGAPLRELRFENLGQEMRTFEKFVQEVNGSVVESSTACMQGCLRRHAISLLSDERTFEDPREPMRPLMECINTCPSNKLQKAANQTYNLACNGSVQAIFEQCPISNEGTKYDGWLAVIKRMLTSGANSSMSAGQNLCDVYGSFVNSAVDEFEARLAEIEDPAAKHECKLMHTAVLDVASVPVRLGALKLGIAQDEFDCGPY